MRQTGGRSSSSGLKNIIVGVADMKISDNPESVITTYTLGSCIALCIWDKKLHVAGMIHYMLPLASASPEKAQIKPAMFCDTGVPALFEKMYDYGCEKKNMIVRAVGGGTIHDDSGHFKIGQRNHTVLRKLLWKNSIMIDAEDVGGTKSRTVRLHVYDGRLLVSSAREEYEI